MADDTTQTLRVEAPRTFSQRLRRLLDPSYGQPAEVYARVAATRLERTRNRLRGFSPLMLALQSTAIVSGLWLEHIDPEHAEHHRLLNYPHYASLPLVLLIQFLCFSQSRLAVRLQPYLPVFSMLYASVVGVGLALAGQWGMPTSGELMLASVGLGVMVYPTGRDILVPLFSTLLPMLILVPLGPGGLETHVNILLNTSTAVAIEIVALRLGHQTIVREIRAAYELERQRAKLAASEVRLSVLNGELEQRVAEQVGALSAHTREVERLNVVLREQVKANALALSHALHRLGERPRVAEGSVLEGRYELKHRLGAGAMGIVFEGLDRKTEQAVAVKLMDASIARDAAAVQRFVHEALVAASVQHPAIVRTEHIAWSEDGTLFQVQELVRGVSLEQVLGLDRKLAERDAAALFSVVAAALAAAHAAGITHRDVKPSNVMLAREDVRVCLLDFGVAKLRETPESFDRTRSGVVVGTPAYLAPEAILDAAQIGPAMDLYALGVLLFRALSGRMPFDRDTVAAVLAAQAFEPVPELSDLPVGQDMARLLRSLLAKSPEERPSADHTREQLEHIAGDRSLAAAIAHAYEVGAIDVVTATKQARPTLDAPDAP